MARLTDGLLKEFNPSLTLDRYQELMQLPIAAFNGLNWPEEQPQLECANIWTQNDRDLLAMWLAVAEEKREDELGYHLAPKYVVDEEHSFGSNGNPLLLDKKHLISVGVEAFSDISSAEAITHRDLYNNIVDPIILTIDDGNTYVASEIVVHYPNEDVAITPSSVTVSGTTITIKIPRSRLVKPELNDNRSDHLYYNDDDNFLETVDVKRRYTDAEGAVNFVWPRGMERFQCPPGCSEVTQTGCAYLGGARALRIAKVEVMPAVWADGSPTGTYFIHSVLPSTVRISYLSGITNSVLTELMTARYAHTLMPGKPCSCPLVEQYWSEDREIIKGYYTPYGNMQGAVNAWMFDSRRKVGIAGTF